MFLDRHDRYWLLASIVIPLTLWWFFIARDKYSMKGQR